MLSFDVSGKLIMNALVMRDRETESLWSQIMGRAVEGPLVGRELTFVPAWHTTWEGWKTLLAHTLALAKGYRGSWDSYASYYQSPSAGVLGETRKDGRLEAKSWVMGDVAGGRRAKAYPLRELNKAPLLHDELGSTSILVVFDPRSGNAIAYERPMELDFTLLEGTTTEDLQTASTWDGMRPLEGSSIRRLRSTIALWFGWKDFYPETGIYSPDASPWPGLSGVSWRCDLRRRP